MQKAVLKQILESPPPTEVNEVVLEASVLSVITNPTNQEALIGRFFSQT